MTVLRPLAAVAAALSLLVVSGCGSDAEVEGPARTMTDGRGESVEVPSNPDRVVVLSELTMDSALALDVTPIGATAGRGQGTVPSYMLERAKDIETVGILAQPNLERIAALDPDIILTDGTATLDSSVMDKLRKIAPTVFVSKTGEDWKVAFSTAAEALDRADEGKKKLDEFDARVEEIKGKLGKNAGAEVSIVRWGGIGLPAVILKELSASRTLEQLGLTRPPSQNQEGPGHSVPVSFEAIKQLDADWMFFGSLGAGGPTGGVSDTPANVESARDAIDAATETPGFTRLRAYQNDHVVPVDGSAWTSAGGYLAQQVVLDDVERTLASGAE